jgi:hypothetical protein
MTKPLIISDCDEVLLFMVKYFKEWLEEGDDVLFHLDGSDFANAMRWKASGEVLSPDDIWKYLGYFFDTEMHRQLPIEGAVESINQLQENADVVILTNLVDKRRDIRAEQLEAVGIEAPVYTNQGPKGPALAKIVAEFAPSKTIFIDDLPQHHQSARETVPQITTLHLCGEPSIAPHITCAHKEGHADARIDNWAEALPWLLNELEKEPA